MAMTKMQYAQTLDAVTAMLSSAHNIQEYINQVNGKMAKLHGEQWQSEGSNQNYDDFKRIASHFNSFVESIETAANGVRKAQEVNAAADAAAGTIFSNFS